MKDIIRLTMSPFLLRNGHFCLRKVLFLMFILEHVSEVTFHCKPCSSYWWAIILRDSPVSGWTAQSFSVLEEYHGEPKLSTNPALTGSMGHDDLGPLIRKRWLGMTPQEAEKCSSVLGMFRVKNLASLTQEFGVKLCVIDTAAKGRRSLGVWLSSPCWKWPAQIWTNTTLPEPASASPLPTFTHCIVLCLIPRGNWNHSIVNKKCVCICYCTFLKLLHCGHGISPQGDKNLWLFTFWGHFLVPTKITSGLWKKSEHSKN